MQLFRNLRKYFAFIWLFKKHKFPDKLHIHILLNAVKVVLCRLFTCMA